MRRELGRAPVRVFVDDRRRVQRERFERVDRDEDRTHQGVDLVVEEALAEGVEDHRLVHRGEHHQIVRRRALEVRRRERSAAFEARVVCQGEWDEQDEWQRYGQLNPSAKAEADVLIAALVDAERAARLAATTVRRTIAAALRQAPRAAKRTRAEQPFVTRVLRVRTAELVRRRRNPRGNRFRSRQRHGR